MDHITQELLEGISQAEQQYYRLVLLVGGPGSGKTFLLRKIHERFGHPLINMGIELSHRMLDLDLTKKQTSLETPEIVRKMISERGSQVVLLDNIEILFDVNVKWDVLGILQRLSKNTTIVAAWAGLARDGRLSYAEPDHPEYKRYEIRDFILVNIADSK